MLALHYNEYVNACACLMHQKYHHLSQLFIWTKAKKNKTKLKALQSPARTKCQRSTRQNNLSRSHMTKLKWRLYINQNQERRAGTRAWKTEGRSVHVGNNEQSPRNITLFCKRWHTIREENFHQCNKFKLKSWRIKKTSKDGTFVWRQDGAIKAFWLCFGVRELLDQMAERSRCGGGTGGWVVRGVAAVSRSAFVCFVSLNIHVCLCICACACVCVWLCLCRKYKLASSRGNWANILAVSARRLIHFTHTHMVIHMRAQTYQHTHNSLYSHVFI